MALDSTGTNAYVLTVSGLSIIPVDRSPADRAAGAWRRTASSTWRATRHPSRPGSLVGIFGRTWHPRLPARPPRVPTVLGGTCVTLNNVAIPLHGHHQRPDQRPDPAYTGGRQISPGGPFDHQSGDFPGVRHGHGGQICACGLHRFEGRAAIYHQDGKPVTKANPTTRDQRLVMYATGLGTTTGGTVVTGAPAPCKPLAVTAPVSVYFGPSNYSQSAIAVEWSGLVPGMIGVYQIDLYVPGTHMKGDALAGMLKSAASAVLSQESLPSQPLQFS